MSSTTPYDGQLARIKAKLEQARKIDKTHEIFGASSHKYRIGPKVKPGEIAAFENRHGVKLPEDYAAFLMHIGNSGEKPENNTAGPFYGLFPFGKNIDEFIYWENTPLSAPAILTPKIMSEAWTKMTRGVSEGADISEEDYNAMSNRIYAGLLPLGPQGCDAYHGLLLTGEYAGRVVNISTELPAPPSFAYESTFLDWYERWLDEIISGLLMNNPGYWFGYSMGGTDKTLLEAFDAAQDNAGKIEALNGLLLLGEISDESRQALLQIIHSNIPPLRQRALQALTKFDLVLAEPFLTQAIHGSDAECEEACESIFWYAKEHAAIWAGPILSRLKTIESLDAFQIAVWVLDTARQDYSGSIFHFFDHSDAKIRRHVNYALGQLPYDEAFLPYFIKGLNDENVLVVHAALQAQNLPNKTELLAPYYDITQRFLKDEHYVLTNLENRLREMGFRDKDDFRAKYESGKGAA